MNTYRVSISDRQRTRTIKAETASEAVKQAVGKRLYSARQDSYTQDRQGRTTSMRYQLNIDLGKAVGGGTLVAERWATVVQA